MKLTTKQLLKIVEENKDAPVRSARNANDVHRFIKDLDIKDGEHAVQTRMIYKTYNLWSSNPYKLKAFFKRFSYYFSPQIGGKGQKNTRYYNLNYRAVELLNKVDNGRIKF